VDGALIDVGDGRWLVNPGSVGQPRDGDPRAAWLTLDTEAETVLFHRVGYDIERTAESIAAADLPKPLADRLFIGH
jgi:diadenosine tetraphosphatase ApaH/serine/threonine PP2A family protein phosphatase